MNATQSSNPELMKQASGNIAGISIHTTAPTASSFREKIAAALDRSRTESARRDALEELSYLLERHPEIGRILELLDRLKL